LLIFLPQRTSTSPTIFSAGIKTNVVPAEAFANINHREAGVKGGQAKNSNNYYLIGMVEIK
jgi:hypothetical protein